MTRSNIGVTFQETMSKTDDPKQQGVVIADVDPLSTGAEAGLTPGDIMLSVNDVVTNARFEEDLPAVRKLIADLPVDTSVTIKVQRGDEEKEIAVKTQALSDLRGKEVDLADWGFTASELTPAIVRRAQLPSGKGVLISGVQLGSVAGNAGLQQGDIALKLDEKEIENLDAFAAAIKAHISAKTKLVLLQVKRGALTRFVIVKQGEPAAAPAAAEQSNGDNGNEK